MRRLSIVARSILDPDGRDIGIGGTERYGSDLIRLARTIGFDVQVHQLSASKYWVRRGAGVMFTGYPAMNRPETDYVYLVHPLLGVDEPIVYLSLTEQVVYRPRSVAIHHGVWWDHPGSVPGIGMPLVEHYIIKSAQQVRMIVSVDANAISVARSMWSDLPNEKFEYLPNYVDLAQFTPSIAPDREFIEVLYPRRYEDARGIYLTQTACVRLLHRYPQIRFHFAIDSRDNGEFDEWHKHCADRDRIRVSRLHFEDMPQAYRDADIVIIPSTGCEGTSLSAIEAMASQRPVIVSNVGGLGNVVIPGFNGQLISPTVEALEASIERYVEDRPLRLQHAYNGRRVAEQALGKTRWEVRWSQILEDLAA